MQAEKDAEVRAAKEREQKLKEERELLLEAKRTVKFVDDVKQQSPGSGSLKKLKSADSPN